MAGCGEGIRRHCRWNGGIQAEDISRPWRVTCHRSRLIELQNNTFWGWVRQRQRHSIQCCIIMMAGPTSTHQHQQAAENLIQTGNHLAKTSHHKSLPNCHRNDSLYFCSRIQLVDCRLLCRKRSERLRGGENRIMNPAWSRLARNLMTRFGDRRANSNWKCTFSIPIEFSDQLLWQKSVLQLVWERCCYRLRFKSGYKFIKSRQYSKRGEQQVRTSI